MSGSGPGSSMDKRPHADRDVEAGFERVLRETLRADVREAGSECIEPDTLAAWCEGALPPSERSFVEAHAARCVRCQSMLAAMARTVPVEAERAPWGLRQWVMMVAPAAAAATAIALWFALEPRRSQIEQPAQQAAVRDAEAPASTVAPARPANEEARASADRGDAQAATPGGQAAVPRERSAAPLADAKDTNRRKEIDQVTAEAKKALERESRAAQTPPPPAAPAAVNAGSAVNANAPAMANTANAPEVNAKGPPPSQSSTTVTAQSPTVQTSQAGVSQQARTGSDQQQADSFRVVGAAAGRGGGRALERAALNESVAVAPVVVAPADGSVQWRALSDRIVQHSADKGLSWATQYTLDDKSSITAGSSPTPLVAWFVGRGGLVIATIDGRTWRRIAFPEPIDLVSVLAIDARTATVTTADRRSFTTTNGGASWTALKD